MSDATSKLTTRWKNIDDMAGRLPQTEGATTMQLLVEIENHVSSTNDTIGEINRSVDYQVSLEI